METLYHYCSNATFHAIVTSRKLRLSSLSASNDFMEGKLVTRAMREYVKHDNLGGDDEQLLETYLEIYDDLLDGLGVCLSEDGDLLSQWRGYADDAAGVAIGFSKAFFEKVSRTPNEYHWSSLLRKIAYSEADRAQIVKPVYDEIKAKLQEEASKPFNALRLYTAEGKAEAHEAEKKLRDHVRTSIMKLVPIWYALKLDAFKEEKEWRLIVPWLGDHEPSTQYCATPSRLRPYIEIDLPPDEQCILEIVVGPKNLTRDRVINAMLESKGFFGVPVTPSKATYR